MPPGKMSYRLVSFASLSPSLWQEAPTLYLGLERHSACAGGFVRKSETAGLGEVGFHPQFPHIPARPRAPPASARPGTINTLSAAARRPPRRPRRRFSMTAFPGAIPPVPRQGAPQRRPGALQTGLTPVTTDEGRIEAAAGRPAEAQRRLRGGSQVRRIRRHQPRSHALPFRAHRVGSGVVEAGCKIGTRLTRRHAGRRRCKCHRCRGAAAAFSATSSACGFLGTTPHQQSQ